MIKATLGERVSDVRASQRLTVERVLPGRRQPRPGPRAGAPAGAAESGAGTKPILEINLRHPLVAAISGDSAAAADLSFLLLEQAQILDGELPEDPAAFAGRLNRLVLQGVAKGG